MRLQEVLKDKKAFKRKEWKEYATEFSADWSPLFKGSNVYDSRRLSLIDLMAEDWEQEESTLTLTRTKIIKAVEVALVRWEKENLDLPDLLLEEIGFE